MNEQKRKTLSLHMRRLIRDDNKSDHILKKSLICQRPSLRRGIFLILFSIIFFCLYYLFIMKHVKIIKSFTDIVTDANEIIIPTFAVILTGYAIFQALVNGSTLINLMTVSEKDKSKFEVYNLYFFSISILYLSLTILNFILLVFLKNVPENWSIPFFSETTNSIIVAVLITSYLTFLVNSLIELKSFVYNLFQCFTINAVSSGIDFLQKDNHK
ncbi:hypothetical protein JF536_11575 [Priestia flexa]|uniref:hypothetical protein n=1 Tax=Priestia flexa TaxID=86664 RepID=UPI001A902909|nr:hypothetical protein [Priestia flexa]MBN8434736.1 hypothetical protein [Priestia flexa]MCA0967273.1 hypothetical protein [Priestia flexa]